MLLVLGVCVCLGFLSVWYVEVMLKIVLEMCGGLIHPIVGASNQNLKQKGKLIIALI